MKATLATCASFISQPIFAPPNRRSAALLSVLLAALSASGWTPPGDGWQYADTGPDERTWTRVALVTNSDLSTTLVTNVVVALSTGRNRETNGQFMAVETELVPVDGGLWCRGARIEALLATNLNTRAAVQVLNHGQWIKLNLLGLAYQDTNGATAWLASIQNCELTVESSNVMVFPNAFSSVPPSSISCDVRYQYGASGLREDVIVHSRPRPPEDYGLSDSARLLVQRSEQTIRLKTASS